MAAAGRWSVSCLSCRSPGGRAARRRRRAEQREQIAGLVGLCRQFCRMDFRFLFHPQRKLLSIGFQVRENRRDESYYDLLASEARLTSFLAVSHGQLPPEHWFALGRAMTLADGRPVLLSWSGSMFEYLMPALLMPSFPGTLLDASCGAAVRRHIRYARRHGVPWGISESCYNRTDEQQIYQYRAHGVPGLGLKRGLGEHLVVAPYASALAMMVAPREAARNLARLEEQGYLGPHGFYDAIDFTPPSPGARAQPVPCRTVMAHHSGMTLLALDNVLLDGPMPRRFLEDPRLRGPRSALAGTHAGRRATRLAGNAEGRIVMKYAYDRSPQDRAVFPAAGRDSVAAGRPGPTRRGVPAARQTNGRWRPRTWNPSPTTPCWSWPRGSISTARSRSCSRRWRPIRGQTRAMPGSARNSMCSRNKAASTSTVSRARWATRGACTTARWKAKCPSSAGLLQHAGVVRCADSVVLHVRHRSGLRVHEAKIDLEPTYWPSVAAIRPHLRPEIITLQRTPHGCQLDLPLQLPDGRSERAAVVDRNERPGDAMQSPGFVPPAFLGSAFPNPALPASPDASSPIGSGTGTVAGVPCPIEGMPAASAGGTTASPYSSYASTGGTTSPYSSYGAASPTTPGYGTVPSSGSASSGTPSYPSYGSSLSPYGSYGCANPYGAAASYAGSGTPRRRMVTEVTTVPPGRRPVTDMRVPMLPLRRP